jgi:geranylgeranyl pyrophosphate synthase
MKIMERFPEDNPVKRIFNRQGNGAQNVKEAIEILHDTGIIEECYQLASDYSDRARCDLALLPDNKNRQALTALADFVVKRNK